MPCGQREAFWPLWRLKNVVSGLPRLPRLACCHRLLYGCKEHAGSEQRRRADRQPSAPGHAQEPERRQSDGFGKMDQATTVDRYFTNLNRGQVFHGPALVPPRARLATPEAADRRIRNVFVTIILGNYLVECRDYRPNTNRDKTYYWETWAALGIILSFGFRAGRRAARCSAASRRARGGRVAQFGTAAVGPSRHRGPRGPRPRLAPRGGGSCCADAARATPDAALCMRANTRETVKGTRLTSTLRAQILTNDPHKRSSRHPLPKMPLLHLTREGLQQLVEVGLAPIGQLAAPLRVAQGVQVMEERARYLDEGGALPLQLGA